MIEGLICVAIAKEVIFGRIDEVSKDFGVSRELMEYIVRNEAAKSKDGKWYYPCGDGDQHLTDPDGNRHRSRGIVQINEYYHPHISDKDAYGVQFSLEFLASNLRQGRCDWWTTCRAYRTHYGGLPYPHTNV